MNCIALCFVAYFSDQGMSNATVLSISSSGVKLGWTFVESCYSRERIHLTYFEPDGTEREKTVARDATEFDIVDLAFSTLYNFSMYIEYDLGNKRRNNYKGNNM